MKQKNIITLEFDAKQIDMAIENLLEGFKKLNTLAKEISTSISNAFAPIHSSLVSIHACINTMSVDVSSLATNRGTGGRFSCPLLLFGEVVAKRLPRRFAPRNDRKNVLLLG